MKHNNLIWGVILIGLGLFFLFNQLFPDLIGWFNWPWILVVLGGIFVVGSLVGRAGGAMVAGLVLLTLGGIFLYQTRTGDWDSWAYLWALIPVVAGIGMLIGGLYDAELRPARIPALIGIGGGLGMLAIMTGLLGLNQDVLRYWPVLLILVGFVIIFRAWRRGRKS